MVGMATLCAVLLTGCSGSDPSDSVMELVKNGDIEQAQQIYAEKISGKEEYESSFAEKFIPYLENLIESYNNGELSEEKINDDFETYKEMLGENVTFKDVESQLSALEISKHCFETAEKLRLEGELTQAYRMYARVIKKDRCYETAQQYITQIPADYLSESEDLFEGGQYQEAVRQSILGYALLDDKSGFDEIAIKVTKRLAEDYGFDNAAVLVEADSFYNTYYDVSVKCDSYKTYGYCLNTLHSYEFDGSAGFAKMQSIMQAFRGDIEAFGGKKVVKLLDYAPGLDGLPKSDVLKFLLEDNCSIVVRPSGTEPKLKTYISVSAENKEAAKKVEAEIRKSAEEHLK